MFQLMLYPGSISYTRNRICDNGKVMCTIDLLQILSAKAQLDNYLEQKTGKLS